MFNKSVFQETVNTSIGEIADHYCEFEDEDTRWDFKLNSVCEINKFPNLYVDSFKEGEIGYTYTPTKYGTKYEFLGNETTEFVTSIPKIMLLIRTLNYKKQITEY